jgi:hypothetical protein
MRADRSNQAHSLSPATFRRMRTEQDHYQADRHAYADGQAVGFFLGLAAAALAWLLFSGTLTRLLVRLVLLLGSGGLS